MVVGYITDKLPKYNKSKQVDSDTINLKVLKKREDELTTKDLHNLRELAYQINNKQGDTR